MPRNLTMIFYGPKEEVGPWLHLGGVPGGLCSPRSPPLELLWPIGCLLVQENSPKSFAAFGLRLVLIFCEVKRSKEQQLALGTMAIG